MRQSLKIWFWIFAVTGLLTTVFVAGALADLCTPEEDRLLEEIQKDRKRERRQEIAE